MKKIIFGLGIIITLLTVLIVSWIRVDTKPAEVATSQVAEPDRSKTFIIGIASESNDLVAEDTKEYETLANYISSKLVSKGITASKVINLVSISGMAQLMRQGRIDILIDSPFPTYVINQLSGAQPIAIRWKNGYEKYNSVIYANASSGIKTLNDLKGKMLVFEDPYSTSGYFLPKSELLDKKYKLVEKTRGQIVGKDEIGYYFSFDGYGEVDKGNAAAAVEIGYKFDENLALHPGAYIVLFKTIDVYRHVVLARSDMDPTLKSELMSILLDMNKDPKGIKVLADISQTSKFSILPNMDVAFNGIRELTKYIEQEIVAR